MAEQTAFRIEKDEDGFRAGLAAIPIASPEEGEVLIRIGYSGVNYKDALAGTGRGKVVQRFPITGGIDAAGVVEQSRHPCWTPGDAVIGTGFGIGIERDGGYAEMLCVPGDWLVPLPQGLDLRSAMILGTAGFTAALAVHRLLANGQHPGLGPIVVTGASGGVGCIAIAILARLGFEVVGVSGKDALHGWLHRLGASRVIGREALPGGERPLESAVWGGAIDNVGGETLARLTRTVVPYGNIASIGLAGGSRFETTVMPFILRGVALLGCHSVDIPFPLRGELWRRLAGDWMPPELDAIVSARVHLEALPEVFERMLAGQTHGRILVQPAGET